MRKIGINLYPKNFNYCNMKTCSTSSQNDESIFSENNKILGTGFVGTSLMNIALPTAKTGILPMLKGLNALVMGFCLLGLLIGGFRKTQDDKLNTASVANDINPSKSNSVLKKENMIKTQSQKPNSKPLRIAVIDNFDTGDSNCGNLKHGDIVTNIIKAQLPNAKIEKRSIDTFSKSLQDIIDNVERGVHYDAVNLSCNYNFSVKLDDIKIFDKNNKRIKLTKDNVAQYKMQIKKYIETMAKEQRYYKIAKSYIDKIEYLTDKKIPVFLSNSNNSSNEICLSDVWDFNPKYSNNNNPYLITVSTDNPNKNYYTELSDVHERGVLELIRTEDGIDYTGDGITDVTNQHNIYELETSNIFEGNSFAVPLALIAHLK